MIFILITVELSSEFDNKSDELIEDEEYYNNEDEKQFDTQEYTQNMKRSQFMTQHTFSTQTEAYNPDQDKREILEIRRSYAHLREELSVNNRELVRADSSKLSELIDEANAIFNRGTKVKVFSFLFFILLCV